MIQLRLLGSVELTPPTAGRSTPHSGNRSGWLCWRTSRRPDPRGFHRRDKVAALFWPELDDERARHPSGTTLTRLRDDVGDDVFASRGADE